MSAERDPRPLEVALQALGIGALMLPVVGVVVRAIEYQTLYPAIPRSIVFSESVGSLSLAAVLTLAVPGLLLLFMSGASLVPPLHPPTGTRVETALFLVATGLATLVLPFPAQVGAFLPAVLLLTWFDRRRKAGRQPRLSEVVQWLLISLLVTVPAIALGPTAGQPVYIVSAQPSAIPTGWYIQLGDSHDPTYLLTCSGSRVIVAPTSSVLSATYGHVDQPDQNLTLILKTGRIDLGLVPSCPAAPPAP